MLVQFFYQPVIVFGQSPTAELKKLPTATTTPKTTPTKQNRDIEILKEKIATKVAELRKKSKTALSGYIKNVSDDNIELEKNGDQDTQIALDEAVTSFFTADLEKTTEAEENITKAKDYIVAFGESIDGVFQATAVYKDSNYLTLFGTVTDTNKSNFTIEVVTFDKEQYTLDIEKNTVQNVMSESLNKLEKGGFSKAAVGDFIHFVIKKDQGGDKKTYSAVRILTVPQKFVKK